MTNVIAQQLRERADRTAADGLTRSAAAMRQGADEIDRLTNDMADIFSDSTVSLRPSSVSSAGSLLQHACHNAAHAAGWWLDTETGEDVRTWPDKFFKLWVSAKLMLCVTELAEAMEGHRKGLNDTHLPHRSMLEVELADTVVRACDLAGGLGLDLGGAIAEKLAYNAQRADHKIENRIAEGGKSI